MNNVVASEPSPNSDNSQVSDTHTSTRREQSQAIQGISERSSSPNTKTSEATNAHRVWLSRVINRRSLSLVVLVVVIRSLAGLADWQSLSQDPDSYARLAVTLSKTGIYGFESDQGTVSATAFRPPLYPWLMSWLVGDGKVQPVGVFALHVVLSLAIAGLTTGIADRLSIPFPLAAGFLVTIDPLLTRASQQVMTELLATALGLAVWRLWLVIWPPVAFCTVDALHSQRTWWQWLAIVALSLSFGLSILARPTAAIWLALTVLVMLRIGCPCWKRRANDVAIVSLMVAACLCPWMLRNLSQLGQPIWATSHGGYTLLLANNPSIYKHFEERGADRGWDAEAFHAAWARRGFVDRMQMLPDSYWLANADNSSAKDTTDTAATNRAATERVADVDNSEGQSGVGKEARQNVPSIKAGYSSGRLEVRSLGELQDDRLAYAIARQTILSHPQTFAKSCVYRLSWFWSCWPYGVGRLQSVVIGAWYIALLVIALVGLRQAMIGGWALFLRQWLPALTLVIALSCVHSVYWSNMRMRCPTMPTVYLLALLSLKPLTCRGSSTTSRASHPVKSD